MYWWLFLLFLFLYTEIKNKRTANWNTDYCVPANKLSFSWRLFVVEEQRKQKQNVFCLTWPIVRRRRCYARALFGCPLLLFLRACVRACSVQLGWVRFFARACARASLLITNITIRVFLPIWEKNLVCWFDLNLNRYKKQKNELTK